MTRGQKLKTDKARWSDHFEPGRTIREIEEFSREQVEQMVKFTAKARIIGGMYVGVMGEQHIEWRDDGSVVVTTQHAPAVAI